MILEPSRPLFVKPLPQDKVIVTSTTETTTKRIVAITGEELFVLFSCLH